jgi:hypothetical protein
LLLKACHYSFLSYNPQFSIFHQRPENFRAESAASGLSGDLQSKY